MAGNERRVREDDREKERREEERYLHRVAITQTPIFPPILLVIAYFQYWN